ncbi:MAG: beta-ketoacyl synthase N-terminal-like domain-containing protein, partial [Henriciella sp.]|uniref:beta-ketoacyl synthase N-terminal-like domain-containing protein n=1 Tax=Henriciella sp. TaxID=1968823 RepID=UPI003C709F96
MAKPDFEPIAIVGRGCVLPGALTTDALWQAILEERDLLSPPPEGKWGVTPEEHVSMTYQGGFVSGFETIFNPLDYDLADTDAAGLDPVFQWLLHAGREAWLDAGAPKAKAKKVGVIAGNLGYPSRALSDFAADIWLSGRSDIDPINRLNTGGPARLLARALGAKGPAFALDAACASSLYAIKLACDRLQDRSLDVVIAAAVNGADNLILHQGFSALNALSPTGRSRPFVEGADGLVPAEGAAAVVLKRLSDCSPDDMVHGVIRGIGLSNDGRRKSLLAPDEGGQAEAMQAAWRVSGLDPSKDIGLLEAHATGTPTGDSVELSATAKHFAGNADLPIGSLKGNLGHLITAAGMASLIKLTYAVNEGIIPATRIDGDALSAFGRSNLAPAQRGAWPKDRPRIAALSNFGFGGNNAHLILAADDGSRPKARKQREVKQPKVSICATGLCLGPDRGVAAVLQKLSRPPGSPRREMADVRANPRALRTPPTELASSQGQQLALWDAVDEAIERHSIADQARVGVFTGFACSPEASRWMLRARIAARLGLGSQTQAADDARNQIAPPLKPGDVLGAMPNVSANRLNSRGDWRAMGFAVMEEEASGLRALELAMRALQAGEIDAAVVAAADLSADPVHREAIGEDGGDAAVALVLKRAKDVDDGVVLKSWTLKSGKTAETILETIYGQSHAAGGLASLAVQSELARRGYKLERTGIAPNLEQTIQTIEVNAGTARLKTKPLPSPDLLRPSPRLEVFAAADKAGLLKAIETGEQAASGHLRLAITAESDDALAARRQAAIGALKAGQAPQGNGIYFGEGPASGELAFMYTGAAAAYRGMGQGLFAAFPELGKLLTTRFPAAQEVGDLLAGNLSSAYDQLRATTLISQAQTLLLRDLLGVAPSVAMGLSSGETNSLIAFGAWIDADGLMGTIGKSGMYTDDLAGKFLTARKAWVTDENIRWETWRLRAPESEIRAALTDEPRCDLTILYSATDAVIAGDAEACQRVLKKVGGAAIRLPHDLIVHTPMMDSYAPT